MKKIITIKSALITALAFLLISTSAFAQAPQKMSYQAVIRDNNSKLVSNQKVGMQISILQGTANGSAVYKETQTPTSNDNGLVSIEIGSGNVVSGDFATIDWANGLYFIKTETDPTGGTNYTITGTSQLMSVPYALHANTADSITGIVNYTEIDPVFGVSIASGIRGTDTTNWNNKLDSYTETDPVFGVSIASGITGTDTTNWNNKQDQLKAGTGIGITGNVISATGGSALKIGDSYQGGTIFWLDATGQHGLIAADSNQSMGIEWYNGINRATGSGGDGLYAGSMNTTMIVAVQSDDDPTGGFAAKVCADYSVTIGGVTYGDWYLPSKYELNLLFLQKSVVGGFIKSYYWSSTGISTIGAWAQHFGVGQQAGIRSNVDYPVRAVRAF